MNVIQPKILCAAGVPGQLVLMIMGQLDCISYCDEISYGKDCGHRYSLSRCNLQEQCH